MYRFSKHKTFLFAFLVIFLNIPQNAIAGSPPPPLTSVDENTDALLDSFSTACSTSMDSGFIADCNDVFFSGDKNTLSALTPDEIIANNTNITSGALNNSFARLGNLRGLGGGSSADSLISRLGVYSNGHSAWQAYDAQGLNPGFKYFDSKAMVGVDYRFTDNFIAGLSGSYIGSDSQLNNNAGSIDSEGYSFAIYSSFYMNDKFYIDGTFAYSGQNHESSRNVFYTGSNQVARGDVDSDTYSAGLVAGYNFSYKGLTITPTMRWMYRDIQIDGYTESLSDPTGPGSGLALAIGEQEYESLTGNFGAQISYAWSQPWGILVPTISGEFIHEFSNSPEQFNVRFVNAPTGTGAFTLSTSETDSDYASVSAGVSAQFSHGFSAFFNYEKILGLKNLTSDAVAMGIRLELD